MLQQTDTAHSDLLVAREPSRTLKLCVCTLLLFLSVSATMFAEASKSSDGSYPYNTFLVPCTVETFKLLVSLCLLSVQNVQSSPTTARIRVSARNFFLFCVPAACYFVSNNCMFYIIRELGPATFQIANNLKVLSTGTLMYVFLGRRLSWLQWKALVLLAVGSMVTQLGTAKDFSPAMVSRGPTFSYFLVIMNALAAGLGGVYSEKLLKGKVNTPEGFALPSIHVQNIQLYLFGVMFGILSVAVNGGFANGQLLDSLNAFAWATVVTLTASGLLVSFILRYIDNVAKCFVGALSMLFTAVLEQLSTGQMIPLRITLGIILTCIALEQYHLS